MDKEDLYEADLLSSDTAELGPAIDYARGSAETRERIARAMERQGRRKPEFAPLFAMLAKTIREGIEYGEHT